MTDRKTTKLDKAYTSFIDLMLSSNDPVDQLDSLAMEDVMGYGTTLDEKIHNLTGLKDLAKLQREQSATMKFKYTMTPVFRKVMNQEKTAVIVDEIHITMLNKGEKIELQMRLSTVLDFIDGNWRVVHWHGSKPEYDSEGSDPWHKEELNKKNEELQKQVDEKTADLENKNRELKIEAALERVRARAMAMQNSTELSQLVDTVFIELTKLDFALTLAIINIIDEGSMSNTVWAKNPDISNAPESYYMKFEDYPFHHGMFKAWKERKTKWVYKMKGKEKSTYDDYLFNETEFRRFPYAAKEGMRLTKQYVASFTFSNFGGLQTVGEEDLSDDSLDILARFGKVFDLTYTRFNDLQRAEAQAKEAQIEAALEKVRSRSLAMHTTNELGEVVAVLVEKLKDLGVVLDANGVVLCTYFQKSKDVMHWIASPDFSFAGNYLLPYFEHPIFDDAWESKESGTEYFSKAFSKDEKDSFFKYAFEHSDYKNFPEDFKHWIFKNDKHILSFAWQKNSAILIPSHTGVLPSEEDVEILKRFSKVFEQSYVRFLDLQKAEAQAREAQIEAALEKVRSRSIGMQKSEELKEVIQVIHDQLIHLNFKIDAAGFTMDYFQNNDWNIWIANKEQSLPTQIYIPYIDHPQFNYYKGAKEKGLDFFANTLSFEDKNSIFRYMFEFMGEYSQAEKDQVLNAPGLAISQAFLKNITLWIYNLEGNPYSEEDNAILMRFAKVFEQTYVRFNDLQKAEAQAREAQIEAALERVRAASMAMHKSEQLSETAMVMFQQLCSLGQVPDRLGIVIYNEQQQIFESWTTDQSGLQLTKAYNASNKEPTTFSKIYKAWKENKDLIIIDLTGQELKNWLRFVKENMKLPIKESNIKNQRVHYAAFFSQGCLMSTFHKPTEHNFNQLLVRFAKVFDQAYTRFLDLQKAEAQVREAQIEAALERVRSKTMAMHNSDDMANTVVTLFEEVLRLGLDDDIRCGIGILEGTARMETRSATLDLNGEVDLKIGMLDMTIHPLLKRIKNGWERGETHYVDQMSGKDVVKYYTALNNEPDYPFLRDLNTLPKIEYHNSFSFPEGIIFAFSPNPMSEEAAQVFERFARVFGQTYRRYRDLLKAEEQARESQIEAALERVRSKAMAMHSSEDLGLTVDTFFAELKGLNVSPHRCGLGIIDKKTKIVNVQAIDTNGGKHIKKVVGDLKLSGHPVLDKIFENWQLQKEYFPVLQGKEIMEYYNVMNPQVKFHEFAEDEVQYGYYFYFKEGGVYAWTDSELPEQDLQIFRRYSSVLSLTYRRYLDLKEAEAQAREAKIEASLERIRSRALSMQKSTEVGAVNDVLFDEFEKMGIEMVGCGISVINEDTDQCEQWRASQVAAVNSFEPFSYKESVRVLSKYVPGFMRKFQHAWKKGDPFLNKYIKGKERDAYLEAVSKIFKYNKSQKKEIFASFPKSFMVNFIFYKRGWLSLSTTTHLTEYEINFSRRFVEAFDFAHTRFLDLQKAELQAKEAVKQASIDRVRAQIASMRSTEDLQRITPLIWQELETLEVPFSRCGVFIIDELLSQVRVYLTTPDGKPLGVLNLPTDANSLTKATIKHWKKKAVYTLHWNKSDFVNWMQSMIELGQIQNTKEYQGNVPPPKTLDLHFIPFTQGMLYVGNNEPLAADKIDLVKSLAKAFSVAYARYEDFKHLEEAKNEIENTFNDLKATQNQLIQAEKMASLGELTAGIAHEIQNPLNFVNNFSEVNAELIEELKEEIDNQEWEEVKAIANDIAGNEAKIKHHGKRADDIVKGMLQHSRTSTNEKEQTDINLLADEYLRLSYHGLRAKDKSFNADFKTNLDDSLPKIKVIPQDIGRVLLNLINNAFYAVSEASAKETAASSKSSASKEREYKPIVIVSTRNLGDKIEIIVKDNGNGIPKNVIEKIFQPFFTTKPTGEGTGLGLSLSYDIITKGHGGELKVETKKNEGLPAGQSGTEFIIQIPINE